LPLPMTRTMPLAMAVTSRLAASEMRKPQA
jgi:hypothetical protein